MKYKRKMILIICMVFVLIVLALASSYALFTFNVTKDTTFKVAIGNLELAIEDAVHEDKFIINPIVPTKDEVALEQEGYTFILTNTGTINSFYTVYLDDIILSDQSVARLEDHYVKVNLYNEKTKQSNTMQLYDLQENEDRILETGYLDAGDSVTYTLRMWVDYEAGNEVQEKYFATQIRIVGEQKNAVAYTEPLLNGADPVIKDSLIPVTIAEDGTVKKADIYKEWYSYEKKQWANAIILKDETKVYKNGQTIPEDNIESYFVWIPKYKYKLFNTDNFNYQANGDIATPHEIEIKFGLTNTDDKIENECTTPKESGNIGNCQNGDWMTHPAFLAFDTNGIWVGKFETGYKGATTATDAQVDSSDSNQIIIKPNVYAWRGTYITNAYKTSFEYQRENLNSHLMKNTEWGAVAYLSYSKYGTCTEGLCTEIRINNSQSYLTGVSAKTVPTSGYNAYQDYNETQPNTENDKSNVYPNSQLASTTLNNTGIFDINGGVWEEVMGLMLDESGESIYEDPNLKKEDFPDSRYYDAYKYSTNANDYTRGILGDATSEMGPFKTESYTTSSNRNISGWYQDEAWFIYTKSLLIPRGGSTQYGVGSGAFAFSRAPIGINAIVGFRIVLAPNND